MRDSERARAAAGVSSVVFKDAFTSDSSLNSSDWVANGPEANASMKDWGYYPVYPATPSLTFSPNDGLNMSGASADYTFVNIQSLPSFFPPFSVQTRVMAASSNGNPISFAVATANGGQGASLNGNLNASNSYYGMGAAAAAGPEAAWVGEQVLANHPDLDTWYILSIDVDASGVATVSVGQGSTVIGTVSYYIGLGAYYVLLGQFVDVPPVTGPNQASWSFVYVNQTAAPSPSLQINGVIADPAFVIVGAPTSIDVIVSGGTPPLQASYIGLPSGCETQLSLTLKCVPTAPGSYSIQVTVTDAHGETSTGETNLTVQSTTASAATPISPDLLGALVLGGAGLVLGAIALALSLRRKGGPGPIDPSKI